MPLRKRDPLQKIFDRKKLRSKLRSQKRERLVFTNGCFDLLHPGHVTYLNLARKLGSKLVVALNDDASVKRLKGSTRPIHRLSDRMLVIAALESVDYVTWFEEDTPLETILTLKPKVLVKGGDYEPEQMVGYQEVLSWGGKVKSLPFVEGHSTTGILRKCSPTGD